MEKEVRDFFNSRIVAYQLSDHKAVTKEFNTPSGKKIQVLFDKSNVPVFKMMINFFDEEYYGIIAIYIGNFIFDGRMMRSKLLENGIKDYKKDKYTTAGEDWHVYRIHFYSLEQFKKIFECFKGQLPK